MLQSTVSVTYLAIMAYIACGVNVAMPEQCVLNKEVDGKLASNEEGRGLNYLIFFYCIIFLIGLCEVFKFLYFLCEF